jgi:hypothetical protein
MRGGGMSEMDSVMRREYEDEAFGIEFERLLSVMGSDGVIPAASRAVLFCPGELLAPECRSDLDHFISILRKESAVPRMAPPIPAVREYVAGIFDESRKTDLPDNVSESIEANVKPATCEPEPLLPRDQAVPPGRLRKVLTIIGICLVLGCLVPGAAYYAGLPAGERQQVLARAEVGLDGISRWVAELRASWASADQERTERAPVATRKLGRDGVFKGAFGVVRSGGPSGASAP